MVPKIITTNNMHILYDDDFSGKVDSQWFDVSYWEKHGSVTSAGQGRGGASFVQAEQGDLVLRHYHRGGYMAALLGDRYLYTGLKSSRAWREWTLLEKMSVMGLPAPQPVAARVVRTGVFYRQDILIKRIEGAVALSQLLSEGGIKAEGWLKIGKCISEFHQAGIYHADLNAHNILLDKMNKVYLVDFDKGEIRSQGSWKEKNISRLKRSLNKLKQTPGFSFNDADWAACMEGYS